MGPCNIPNISGAKGFVTFIDDCTQMTWVYLLKRKSDVSHILPNFTNMIRNQFGVSIKGLELIKLGTTLIRFYHHTLKKKGLFINHLLEERKKRHLLETTRALLFQHQVPKNY